MFYKLLISVVMVIVLNRHANAQSLTENSPVTNEPNVTTVVETPPVEKAAKNYKLSLTMAKNASLFKTGDGKDTESLYGALSGSYKFSDGFTGGFLVDRGYDEKTQEADWFRMSLSATLRKLESRHFDATPRISLGLPANKKDFADSLRARVGISAVVAVKTNMPKLEFSYTPILGYSNFAYTTNEFTGNPNSPFSFLQDLTAAYSFTEKLSAKVSVLYLVQQTSSGFAKEAWAHGQELGWQVNKNFALAVGHQFGAPYAPTRRANQEVNLTLFDDKDSIVYTQLTISI